MKMHATTIVGVRAKRTGRYRGRRAGDPAKHDYEGRGKKIRRMYQGRVLAGFAGSVADAQSLADKFEAKFEQTSGNLRRAVIEFAKEWRTDRVLRRLEAMMIVADPENLLLLSGDGNVIEPDDGVLAIGSGGPFGQAAARALVLHTSQSARDIVQNALEIAADICIYTNHNIVVDSLGEPNTSSDTTNKE